VSGGRQHRRPYDTAWIRAVEERGEHARVALVREHRLEEQRAAGVDLERRHAEDASVDRDQVPPGVERGDAAQLARAEHAAHVAVHHLLGRERERIVRDERRPMREDEREADEAVPPWHRAPAGQAAPEPHAGIRPASGARW
jgi:hypothetical protein